MRVHLVALALVVTVGCSKTPERKGFTEKAAAAVAAKDGRAVWELLDKGSKARIVGGIQKAQAKAAADERWKALFAAANAPVDTTLAPEAVAVALVSAQLAGTEGFPIDDGKTGDARVENGAWRMKVEPMGFVEDGTPLTLVVRAPGSGKVRTPEAGVSEVRIQFPLLDRFTGARLSPDEITARYREAAAHVAEKLSFPAHYGEGAARVMLYYRLTGDAIDAAFSFDPGAGAMTPIVVVYDKERHGEAERKQPVLAYGAW